MTRLAEPIQDLPPRKRQWRDAASVGFVVTLAVLLIAGVLGYINADHLAHRTEWVDHTYNVIASLERMLSSLKDAETAQRGYLLTGEEEYLQPYDEGVGRAQAELAHVKTLTADNPDQQTRLAALERTIGAKLHELKQTVVLMKQGDAAGSLRIVRSNVGKRLMDDIRNAVAAMQTTEKDLLRKRASESEASYRTVVRSIVLSSAIALVLVTLVFILSQRNLTLQRRAADAVADQRERLRTTLASIGDAVISTDVEGRITNMNGVAASLTGWTIDAAIGQPLDTVFRIVNEETRTPVESPATRALKEGTIVGLANHSVLIAKDGTEWPIDDSAAPIRCKLGDVVGCVLVFRDISARRRAEQRTEEALNYAESIVDTVREPLLVLDADLRVKTANRSYYRAFDVGRDQTENRLIDDLGNRQWAIPRLRELLEDVVAHNTPFQDYEVEHDFEAVGRRIMLLNAQSLDPRGHGAGLVLLAIDDVTGRRAAEEQLREREENFRGIFHQAIAGIAQSDLSGRIVRVNERFCQLVGRSADELYGLGMEDLTHPDDVPRNRQLFERLARDGTPFVMEKRYLRTDGSAVWVRNSVSVVKGADGLPKTVLAVSVDITDRKAVEDELRKLAADLSEADRRKNEFLAMLAHELRNPLAPIRNALNIMQLTHFDRDAIASASAMMDRQLQQMVRFVDDLIDVSRVNRGTIELRKGPTELASAVNHAVEAVRPSFERMEHHLTVMLPPQPLYLNADPARIAQVVGNLLNNACKFTKRRGRISLTVEREGALAAIRVQDNGIGIAADQLPRIFDMFMQVDTSLERSASGLGIGLTLVKNLVELHGGTVDVRSPGLGQGSEFIVRLPLLDTPAAMHPLPEPELTPMPPRRILVVDDNRDAATSLAMLLNLTGNETAEANDGLEALEVAEVFRPEVILLDIGLPKLNGYEVVGRIRQRPWAKAVYVVALTGWGQEADRQKSKEAGFDGHLVKPVDLPDLTKVLAALPPRGAAA